MPRTAEVGERQHGNPGFDVEPSRRAGRKQSDLRQIFRRGLDVHRGVRQEKDSILPQQDVQTRDPVHAFAHPDDLQGWPNRVRVVHRQAGDHRVGVAHVKHHRSKVARQRQQLARFGHGHALSLTQVEKFRRVLLEPRVFLRVHEASLP